MITPIDWWLEYARNFPVILWPSLGRQGTHYLILHKSRLAKITFKFHIHSYFFFFLVFAYSFYISSPLLFNIFISDQPSNFNTKIADYAEDKAIVSIHENRNVASENLQLLQRDEMSKCCKKWNIKTNESKSVLVTFTLRKKIQP